MAHFGSPFASGFGRVDNHLHDFKVVDSAPTNTLRVSFSPTEDMGDAYFGIYLNGRKVNTLFVSEGSVFSGINLQRETGIQDVQVLRQGHSKDMDLSRVARVLEYETASTVTLEWDWEFDFVGANVESTYLTNWDLSPINPEALDLWDRPTRRSLRYDMTTTLGVTTVNLLTNEGGLVGTGSGPVGTTINITGEISGTVDADLLSLDESGTLIYRWPRAMNIYRDAALAGTANFEGLQTTRWTDPSDLSPGSYDYALQTISDTEATSPIGTPTAVVIPDPPEPATDLAYVSGTAPAITIGWTESPTPSATYNLYVQYPDDLWMNFETPLPLPNGTDTYVLDPILTNPGVTRILLRAVLSGVEERFGAYLEIETDASGNYVPPRPNNTLLGTLQVEELGGILDVEYQTAFEGASPSHAQVFVRTPTGTYDYDTPAGEAPFGPEDYRARNANVTFSVPSEGFWFVTTKARTSAGVQSLGRSRERKVFFSDAVEVAPDFEIELSRS